jgi:hypothetical protein
LAYGYFETCHLALLPLSRLDHSCGHARSVTAGYGLGTLFHTRFARGEREAR